MSILASSFRFGGAVVKRASQVRAEERSRVLTPASAMHEILSSRDPAAIMRLYDALRRTPRLASPSYAELAHAKRSIERALREGEIVALRPDRRGGGVVADPTSLDLTEPVPEPPPAEELSWFEITMLDDGGQPVDSVDVIWSSSRRTRRVRTDLNGTARVDDVDGSFASVRLSDPVSVRDRLRARDTTPDPSLTEGLPRYEVGDRMGDIALESERPTTVVLGVPIETWFGIELVDRAGLPLAGQAFRLVLEDGGTIDGVLDESGKARVSLPRTVTAPCKISFPGLDASVFAGGESGGI